MRASVKLRFIAAGTQAVVRYPVDQHRAAEIDEAVSRALLEAIELMPNQQGAGTASPQLDLNIAPEA